MNPQNLEVSVRWESSVWVIREAGYTDGPGIKADALVIQPHNSKPGAIRGFIISVHGIDQEVAKQLVFADLKQLGVGAHITKANPQGDRRLYLGADGEVTKGV